METLIATGNSVVTPSPLSTTTTTTQTPAATTSSAAEPATAAASALVDVSTSTETPTIPDEFQEKIITTMAQAMTTISTPTQTPYYDMPSPIYDLDYYEKSLNGLKMETTSGPDAANASIALSPCPTCSRTFNPETLRKHANICQKMATKKRRVFDSQRQRREGTELAAYPLPKNYGLPPVASPAPAAPTTQSSSAAPIQPAATPILSRKKSNDELVRSTARASVRKQAAPATPAAAPTAPVAAATPAAAASGSNFIRDRMRSSERLTSKRGGVPVAEQCPHCDRHFGVKAYDRHVEWCKEKALQASIKQTNNNKTESNVAKERLEARIKYRAPCLKTKRSLNREKYSGNGDDNEMDSPPSQNSGNSPHQNAMSISMTSSMTSESGLPDNYDPFLSAKRQLEELCSPTTSQQSHATTPSTPSVPIMPNKMTSSLTLSTSTPNSSPLTNTQPRTPNSSGSSTAKTNVTSNFRRTSSLRGPRRSPMLSSRPLFAQKLRPTIQRGLSDEGPISTNFLKPEEYDEMPVRSVCVNDFAITNSPRVVRRDTSNSNRKQNLKLNVNASGPMQQAANSSEERLPTASKYLSKTDSLAVFLKYENELSKLSPTPATAPASTATSSGPVQRSPPATPSESGAVEGPVITKEFKDKSNILSKQNSVKSIKPEATNEPNSSKSKEEPPRPSTHLPTPVSPSAPTIGETSPSSSKENNENFASSPASKYGPIRLEPISKPATPLSKPLTPLTKPNTPFTAKSSCQLPAVNQPINLNSILGESKPPTLAFAIDRKLSSSSEYIDPKLINKCDNLPVNLKSASDCYENRHESSSNSSEQSAPAAAPISQLTKLLPLTKPELSQTASIAEPAETASTTNLQHRNSAEGRNLLKRKIRLGRNQFLYDAPSPEADSCSADDEANRSSVEYDDKQFSQIRATLQQQKQQQQQQQQPQRQEEPPSKPSTMPPIPVLDDFDFEEFLSSFENDDEQFPLFKDCREFLMNRSSNKKRSTLSPNSNTFTTTTPHNISNNNNTNQTKSSSTVYQSPSQLSFPSQSLFQFPQLPRSPMFFSQTPSFRSASENYALQHESNAGRATTAPSELDHKKREIFISIETETEQNDLGRSPISPESLRSMVGNSQATVEVEVDGNDNKFSKISDDEPVTSSTPRQANTMGTPYESGGLLPNVQLNNAKNLIQKMQEDFRQMSEEAGSNLRSAVANSARSSTAITKSNSYFLPEAIVPKRPSTTSVIPIPAKEQSRRPGNDAVHDSDEMSSLESFPMSSQSSRQGAGSKLSADSAYGSLSRQRSTEMAPATQRSIGRTPRPRPGTANCSTNTMQMLPKVDAATQHQHMPMYSAKRSSSRQREALSSSGSENSLTNNPLQHQQAQQLIYMNNMNNNNANLSHLQYDQVPGNHCIMNDNHNYNICESLSNHNNNNNFHANLSNVPSRSTSSSSVSTAATGSVNSSQMTASMKMSKFCHECGSKFIIANAKFCMDCGVKRIVL